MLLDLSDFFRELLQAHVQEIILLLKLKFSVRDGLLQDVVDRLVRDGSTESRSIYLIEIFLHFPVCLLHVLNVLQQFISVDLLILRLDLLLSQPLLQLSILHVQLFNLAIPRIDHLCELVLSNTHFSEDLPLLAQLIFRLMLVNGEPSIKLVLDLILLAFKLIAHLAFEIYLRLHDTIINYLCVLIELLLSGQCYSASCL